MAILRQYLLSPTSLIRDANATTAQPNAKHTGQSVHLCTAGYPLKERALDRARSGDLCGLQRPGIAVCETLEIIKSTAERRTGADGSPVTSVAGRAPGEYKAARRSSRLRPAREREVRGVGRRFVLKRIPPTKE